MFYSGIQVQLLFRMTTTPHCPFLSSPSLDPITKLNPKYHFCHSDPEYPKANPNMYYSFPVSLAKMFCVYLKQCFSSRIYYDPCVWGFGCYNCTINFEVVTNMSLP